MPQQQEQQAHMASTFCEFRIWMTKPSCSLRFRMEGECLVRADVAGQAIVYIIIRKGIKLEAGLQGVGTGLSVQCSLPFGRSTPATAMRRFSINDGRGIIIGGYWAHQGLISALMGMGPQVRGFKPMEGGPKTGKVIFGRCLSGAPGLNCSTGIRICPQ